MTELHPIESSTSASIAQRRARLTERIRKSGCRSWRITNSMQELLAISYLNRLGREARSELLGSLSASRAGNEQSEDATSGLVTEFSGTGAAQEDVSATRKAGVAEAAGADAAARSPMPSLFEQSLSTTGLVVSERT